MLRNLHIKNMALIDEIEVDFENGLNILTGETGAGKSIILGAVTIALGGSTGKEMLREGVEYGLVELLFEIENPATKAALEAIQIPISDEQILIISRKIYPNRVQNKVNDEMVTVGKLKEIAGILIDIHSQHEHQSLMYKHKHLEILDIYAGEEVSALKEKLHILDCFGDTGIQEWKQIVAKDYEEYVSVLKELEENTVDEETRKRQLDFAEYEIKEIQSANLREDEEDELENRYRKMANGRQIMESVIQVHQMSGYDQTGSAGDQLGHALSYMNKAAEYDSELKNLQEQLMTIDNLLNDFNHELADYISEMSFDEQEFRETEQRLDLIHNLESKYGRTIADVLRYLDEKKAEVSRYEDYEAWKQELDAKRIQLLKQYEKDSGELSRQRKQTAEQLTAEIRQALLELNFQDVRFEMKFDEKQQPGRDGVDDAYFMISTNIGEPLKPLWEVASGGELSRVMLAIKSCLAEEDSIDTLIFDEIDVGISGRTAQKVSEKLSAISSRHQVICISHLPQIAAMADSHYKIEKSVVEQKTHTNIEQLNEAESIREIARLLGGVEITDTVFKSAEEMKNMAKQTKTNQLIFS